MSGTANVGFNNPGVAGGLLAGWNSGTVRNSYTTGTLNAIDGSEVVGGLVGINTGTIFNSHSTATVGGDASASEVGGLVGANYGGAIGNSYATGSVAGSSYVGGLVGQNSFNANGFVNSPGATLSKISNSYATGNVSGAGFVGGLVGVNLGDSAVQALVTNSYAKGSVSGGSYVGGLAAGMGVIGAFPNQAIISNSYSTGSVSGSSTPGGLLAVNGIGDDLADGATTAGRVTGSFWDTTTSGQSSSAGGTGMTTSQMQTPANFTSATTFNGNSNPAWDTTVWALYSGSYPLLIADMIPLTIKANNVVTTYDGSAFSGDVNGVTYSVAGAASSLSGTISYSGTSQGAVDVGSGPYSIVPSGLSVTTPTQSGYYITTYATGTLTINELALTGSISAGSSTYGSVLAPGTPSFTNVVGGDNLGTATVAVNTVGLTSGSGNLTAGTHTGIETITGLSGPDAGNYTFAGVTGNYTVNPLTLTATIATGNSVYGAALAPGAVSFSNLISGDTVTAGSVTVTTTGLTSTSGNLIAGNHAGIEAVGTTLSGADAGNYTFAGATGNYNVSQLALTGAIATGTSTYGSALTPGAVSFNNLVSGDTVTAGSVSVATTGLTRSSGNLIAGNHTGIESVGTTLSGADAGNYTFAGATGNYNVSQLALTGAITTGTSTYGSALTPGTFSFNNLISGDTVTAGSVSVATTGLTSSSGNLIAGNHAGIESVGTTLSGADAGNYTFVGATGNYNVSQLALTGAIATGSSIYGSALTPGTVSFNNLIVGDTVTAGSVSVSTTGLTSTSGNLIAGNHAGIESIGTTLSGADANNYTFAGATGNYDVGTLALLVTGSSAANKVYDGTNSATVVGGTLSSVIGGDSVSLSQSGSFAAKNVGNGIAVTATDSLGGSSAGNYTLVEPTGLSANITPATLVYTANPASGFAAQVPPLSGAVSGFVPGDTQANATTGSPSWTTSGNTNQPGQYAIDGSGLTAGNYAFVQAPGNASALTLAPATAPQPVVDVRSDLESETLSSQAAVTVDTTAVFAGSVPVHVIDGGLKLPADTVGSY